MEIYYLKKDEFLTAVDLNSLEKFTDGREYKCQEKYFEHLCGLFLVRFVAKNVYGLENTDIILKNNKPHFASESLCFSISHSGNIVMAAFNNRNIGLDVEFMYPRNYHKIMERYDKNVKNPTRQDFYRFWTLHEAEIKLGTEPASIYSVFLNEDYVYTCVSDGPIVTCRSANELVLTGKNIDVKKEYEQSRLIKC